MPIKGIIFDITRGSFHDGNGIRDVVYFKGCPLSCAWCHNPEGQKTKMQLCWISSKCIGCGTCTDTCPHGNFIKNDGGLAIDFENCSACGRCCDACPTNALKIYGKAYTPDELLSILYKDKDYFGNTGGVTFSGGECLIQNQFMEEILELCKKNAIHTLIETSLCVSEECVRRLIPLADEVYCDIKHMDSDLHKKFTGSGNELILSNIKLLSSLGTPFTVRTPLIPECNDSMDNLLKTAEFAYRNKTENYVLLPYNPLGVAKYNQLGRKFLLDSYDRQNDKTLETICRNINTALNCENFVVHQ